MRVLIAPLNWGLGHATRSLAVAAALRRQSDEVDIHWASDGQALALLRAEVPEATVHTLPGAEVRYPTRSALLNMALAAPRLWRTWRAEHQAVQKLQRAHSYDLIISDNRFGCRIKGVPSYIMTHQLHLPLKPAVVRKLGNWLNHRLLRRFDRVLVPDYADAPRLAGAMSNPLPTMRVDYIGPASRFVGLLPDQGESGPKLLVLLSGPEPMRTRLEEKVLPQLMELKLAGRLVVRGLPARAPQTQLLRRAEAAGITVVDFLPAETLGPVLAKAETILTRPGYTTVMDLAAMGRNAIYVPTPGQPEQQWLGASLHAQARGICCSQAHLHVERAMAQLASLSTVSKREDFQQLDRWASRVVSDLRQRSVNKV